MALEKLPQITPPIHSSPSSSQSDFCPERHSAEFLSNYEIKETVEWINRLQFSIVGLQFPDQLLPLSVPVLRALRSRLSQHHLELYIMADTTYGSCCVDEIAAKHVNAQAVIHYGSACLSITPSLPVFYVLPKLPLSDELIENTCERLTNSACSVEPSARESKDVGPTVLIYDVGYHWRSENIAECLQNQFGLPVVREKLGLIEEQNNLELLSRATSSMTISQCHEKTCCQSASQDARTGLHQPTLCSTAPENISCEGRSSSTPTKNRADYSKYRLAFYIGDESARLTHFLVTNPSIPVIAIDPRKTQEGSIDHTSHSHPTNHTKKLLMRRYATIQRARDADVFGILVGTLGVRHYLELINRTKRLIENEFRKKAYVISVGKLKPEKLMNFAEIETWVLVDCPESSLLKLNGKTGIGYDPKQFGAPIITPWELEIALNSCIENSHDQEPESQAHHTSRQRVWNGQLVLDFEEILSVWQADDAHSISNPASTNHPKIQEDGPVFSLVTGGYKHRRNWQDDTEPEETKSNLLTKSDSTTKQEVIRSVKGAASEFALNHRTYFGLEARHGLDPPSKVSVGRFGIAQAYADDHPPTHLPELDLPNN